MEISEIVSLPAGLDRLVSESEADGFRFVRRLVDDYASGRNRFSGCGEALLAVYEDGYLIGVGGINSDPYCNDKHSGRVRRLYILKDYRNAGVGRALMEAIEQHASKSFKVLNLFTDTDAASRFYVQLGYNLVREEKRTHYKVLS
ncbi:GNAT family N-acetyltransferase [Gynuella sunshinyii]|uniref:GNAT family N-acetyltransferase n=1 Tax=Gynuella sunshinyii TaxID=1445505 RepID=UPI0005CC31F1|nr:GNAT family N-acetyltransferase [Gynuella sunshinyii]